MNAQATTNTRVTVRLTQAGIDILKKRHDRLSKTGEKPFVAPENNMYTVELWWLMMVFGEHMSPLRAAPFEHDIAIHRVAGDVEL